MAIYALILNLIHFVGSSINLSLENFTTGGLLRAAFDPYYSVFGELTWGIILGFIGGALYINERSIGTATTYLILVGIFVSVIFPSQVVAVFGILLAFLIAIIFYKAFIESG